MTKELYKIYISLRRRRDGTFGPAINQSRSEIAAELRRLAHEFDEEMILAGPIEELRITITPHKDLRRG